MIHLQALKPFKIHSKSQIDKHIKILKDLHTNAMKNKASGNATSFFMPVSSDGNVPLFLCMTKGVNVGTPISIGKTNLGVVIFVKSIPTSVDTTSKENLEDVMYKCIENVRKVTHGLIADEISMVAHEATHMIDLSTWSGAYHEGSDSLVRNFVDQNWLEINALLNQVVYCFPDATQSYEKFNECFMDEKINYTSREKATLSQTPDFKQAVTSIIK